MLRKILLGTTVLGLAIVSSTSVQAQRYDVPHIARHMWKLTDYDRNVQANIDSAQEAITNCNRADLDRALANLDKQQDELEGQARQAPNEFFDPSVARQKAQDVSSAKNGLKSLWNDKYPCGNKEEPQQQYASDTTELFEFMKLSAAVSGGRIHIPGLPGYVGSEEPGMMNTRRFEEIKPSNSALVNRLGFDLTYSPETPNILPNVLPNLFPNLYNHHYSLQPIDLFLGVDRTTASFNEVNRMYSANGRDTLLVGVGAGPSPSGYVIGAANGDIENIRYDRDFESTRFEAGFGQEMEMYNNENEYTLRPYVGLGYGHSTNFEWLGGVTNSGTLNFDYTSKITSHSYEPFIGVDFSARPQYLSNVFGTDLQLNAGARYGYEIIDVDGYDSLAVTGALNQTGMVDLDDDEHSHNFKFNTGIVLNPDGPINFEIGAAYERTDNALVIMRTGTEESSVDTEGQNVFIGTIRSTFTF